MRTLTCGTGDQLRDACCRLLALRGGGKANLYLKKKMRSRQILYRSNHRTMVKNNPRARKMLHNKKRQGFVGVKRIIRDTKKKMEAQAAKARKKRQRKEEERRKFYMFQD
uniref:Uncharacterized protein n=1 Tax=Lotharella globosa TaxID=91324 RepID=A0A6U2Z161_9EUKA|mmetsp:Transcript_6532/g.12918  ORF Transcript_6532/g.12918 Transcript_6532/m.12918 type:complete len:110 (+) Transcript_6532:179-508(+)